MSDLALRAERTSRTGGAMARPRVGLFRPWQASIDEGWTRCELVDNVRNTSQIARLLQRRLGGGNSPIAGPDSEAVRFVDIDAERLAHLASVAAPLAEEKGLDLVEVAPEKVPVERREWTGVLPRRFSRLVTATLAVVRHAIDVVP